MLSAPRFTTAVLGLLLAGIYVGAASADDKPAAPSKDAPAAAPGKDGIRQMGEHLIKGLKETPGCLGVESGQTSSGKAVIFAFFENKKAAMKWYFSPTHRAMIEMLGASYEGKRTPMKGVPDDVPIMAVASISFAGKPASPKTKLPVSQISIELYSPLSGGLSIGGGFAPDAFRALSPKPEAKTETKSTEKK
jgi:hypothetical protein